MQPAVQQAVASAFERIASPRSEGPALPVAEPKAPLADLKPAAADTQELPAETLVQPKQDGQRSAPREAQAAKPEAGFNAALDKAAGQAGGAEQFKVKDIQQVQAPSVQVQAAPVQQSALAQAVANVAGDKIAARVGTPAWDNQVGQKIVWMVAGGEQSASLTLNPPDLGPMQVVLNVTNDQADVTFTAAQPEVRQALEDAMPRLKEMLGESGLSLGNASVNAGMSEQQQAQSQAFANNGGGSGQGGRGGAAGGAGGDTVNDTGSAAAAEARAAARAERTGTVRSMVDTFV